MGLKRILCLAAALLLAGCAPPRAGAGEAAPREALLLWSYYETDAQRQSLDTLARDFNTSQNRYALSWEYLPMADFSKKLAIGVTENALPDLVLIDSPDMAYYVEQGLFADITAFVQAHVNGTDYYPAVWQTVQRQGRFYGLPFCCNNLALFYNTALLEEAGLAPPQTFEGLKTAAARLSGGGRYGFLMSGVEGEQAAFQLLPWILSTGEAPAALGGDGTRRALALLHTLVEEGSMDPNCVNYSQIDIARKFVAGEAAMMENGPWVLPLLREAGTPYGIARLPADQGQVVVSGGENIGVVRGGNVEGALALLNYYGDSRVMGEICRQGCALPPKREQAEALARADADYLMFTEQMDGCVVRSSLPNWPALSGLLSDTLYRTLAEGQPPEDTARWMAGRLQALPPTPGPEASQ